ncbi:MAG: hypothetical protein V4596_14055 [Bdellovibrionota bacterium]
MKKISLFILFYSSISFGSPQETLYFDLMFNNAIQLDQDTTLKFLSTSMNLIKAAPVNGVAFTQDQAKQLDFIIEITDSQKVKEFNKNLEKNGAVGVDSADAYTVVISVEGNTVLLVRLIWDKILYDKSQRELADGLVRLTVTLAHELYGNVFRLNKDIKSGKLSSSVSSLGEKSIQIESEIHAYKAGIQFIEQFIEKFHSSLPSSVLNDFEAALKRERKALEGWQLEYNKLLRSTESADALIFVKTKNPTESDKSVCTKMFL